MYVCLSSCPFGIDNKHVRREMQAHTFLQSAGGDLRKDHCRFSGMMWGEKRVQNMFVVLERSFERMFASWGVMLILFLLKYIGNISLSE